MELVNVTTRGIECMECSEVLLLEIARPYDCDFVAPILSRLYWMLSVCSVWGISVMAPLCPPCARRVHGDRLVEAAHQIIAGRRS